MQFDKQHHGSLNLWVTHTFISAEISVPHIHFSWASSRTHTHFSPPQWNFMEALVSGYKFSRWHRKAQNTIQSIAHWANCFTVWHFSCIVALLPVVSHKQNKLNDHKGVLQNLLSYGRWQKLTAERNVWENKIFNAHKGHIFIRWIRAGSNKKIALDFDV